MMSKHTFTADAGIPTEQGELGHRRENTHLFSAVTTTPSASLKLKIERVTPAEAAEAIALELEQIGLAIPARETWLLRPRWSADEAAWLAVDIEPSFAPKDRPYIVTWHATIAEELRAHLGEEASPADCVRALNTLGIANRLSARTATALPDKRPPPAPSVTARQLIPRLPIQREREEWALVIEAVIAEFEHEHGFTPNHAEAWHRFVTKKPRGFDYSPSGNDPDSYRIASCRALLNRESFKRRFNRRYRDR